MIHSGSSPVLANRGCPRIPYSLVFKRALLASLFR